jgi:F-type H+-transporting ATPase subunit delta
LYSLADKAGGVAKVESDLALAAEAVASHDGLRQALLSPTVADSVKRTVLEKIFTGKVSDTVLRFLYVLVDKGREEYLSTILEVFRDRLRADRGEVECHVTSAKKLTAELRKSLEQNLIAFTGKKITLAETVDPDLIAGMVVVVGDRVIDASFRHQLTEIQDKLARVSSGAALSAASEEASK